MSLRYVSSEPLAHLEVSLDVALALLEFTSRDSTRPHLHAVFVDSGALCATDGHALLMFNPAHEDNRLPVTLNKRGWCASYVERAVKRARVDRRAVSQLWLGDCMKPEYGFPPASQVVPEYEMDRRSGPIGVDPSLLARLKRACKACGVQFATLAQLRGPLDPIGFVMPGAAVFGRAVIMPGRI